MIKLVLCDIEMIKVVLCNTEMKTAAVHVSHFKSHDEWLQPLATFLAMILH